MFLFARFGVRAPVYQVHTDHPLPTRCIGCQLSSQQKHFGAVIITASFSHAVFIIWPHTLLDVFPAAPPFYSAFVMTGTSYWKRSKVAVFTFFLNYSFYCLSQGAVSRHVPPTLTLSPVGPLPAQYRHTT